jgi:hypothetical protein
MIKIPALRIPFFLLLLFLSSHLSAYTTVEKQGDAWVLSVNGEPFEVKGATFGYEQDKGRYDAYFKELNFLGVNTIRTWGVGENTEKLLDAAHRHNIKVMLGIWMRHGRPGMEADDRFNYLEDSKGKEEMYDNAITQVQKYKYHPAVLLWGIGNEVYLNTATDEEKEAYSRLLERICRQVKALDPNHPVASVEAWTFGLDWWQQHVPSLDIYGLNSYGPGVNILADELAKKGIDKPYIVTEFGVTGEWDVREDKNGVKVEPADAQKYEAIVKGYHEWISNKAACLGVYVFHYGDGEQFGAPWLLTHFRGMTRPQYWAIREAYTGEKPVNQVPIVESFQLPDTQTKSGSWVPVQLEVSDKEQEALTVDFFYNQRSGSRKRRDQLTTLPYRGSLSEGFELQLPPEHGAIKVYVAVHDTYQNVGIASTSISVLDKEAKQRKYLVPRVDLPFYVYQDDQDLPYIPSAYMGNYQAMQVDMNHRQEVKSGKTAIKIRYRDPTDWYGLGLVDPADDWGDILGGYDIGPAKTFSFWAKGSQDDIQITAGFGLIGEEKPFPDTGKESIEIRLTRDWKKYSLKIEGVDLSCIRSGFVIFSGGTGVPHDIYIDDIVFE